MGKRIVLIAFLLETTLFSGVSRASEQVVLTEVALFHRCYTHLTGRRAAPTHPSLAEVASGVKTAVQACMDVFNRARLSLTTGLVANTSDQDALWVLETFHAFFRSWFGTLDFATAPSSYSQGYLRVHDPTEEATALTYLLFTGQPYRQLVTGQRSWRALRSFGARDHTVDGNSWHYYAPLNFSNAGIQRGVLWGVMPYALGNNTWTYNNGVTTNTLIEDYTNRVLTAERSFGAGILGSQSFAIRTFGYPSTSSGDAPTTGTETDIGVATGGIRMPRRWALNVFRTMLCEQNFMVRRTDTNTMVSEYIAANPDPAARLPFRVSTHCMSCHAGLDSMGATFRGAQFFRASQNDFNGNGVINTPSNFGLDTEDHTLFLKVFDPAVEGSGSPSLGHHPQPLHLINRTASFRRYLPDGALFKRSIVSGDLINVPITATTQLDGLEQLGDAISNTDDYYYCAASRFFKFFTGVAVPTRDPGDSRYPPLTADESFYKAIAADLGTSLRGDQRLDELVRRILSLPVYRNSGFRQ